MVMNRRFRRPPRRAKRLYHWHREIPGFTALAANTTNTTNLLIPGDWASNGELSPGSVTLYAVKWNFSIGPAAFALSAQTRWTWGIYAVDEDSAAVTPGAQDDLIDERWLAFGSGGCTMSATTVVNICANWERYDGSTKARVKLLDQNINLGVFNHASSGTSIIMNGIVSLLVAGDTN